MLYHLLRSLSDDVVDFRFGFRRLRILRFNLLVPRDNLKEEAKVLPSAKPAVARGATLANLISALRAGSRSVRNIDDEIGNFRQGALWNYAPCVHFCGHIFNFFFRTAREEKMCEAFRIGFVVGLVRSRAFMR